MHLPENRHLECFSLTMKCGTDERELVCIADGSNEQTCRFSVEATFIISNTTHRLEVTSFFSCIISQSNLRRYLTSRADDQPQIHPVNSHLYTSFPVVNIKICFRKDGGKPGLT
jgi:hypothetical protein